MQVVENWAEVKGTVHSVAPHPSLGAHSALKLQVESVADVAGYPNLFRSAAGQMLEINVPNERMGELALTPGDQVTLRIRRGGPGSVFAHPEGTAAP